MTIGVPTERRSSRFDKAIAPGVALCFSLLVPILEPQYTRWYADTMPWLTAKFIDDWPTWVAITAAGVLVQILRWRIGLRGPVATLLTVFDFLLAAASVLIIVIGLIALALPLLMLQLPI
jgi:hypothetical protein